MASTTTSTAETGSDVKPQTTPSDRNKDAIVEQIKEIYQNYNINNKQLEIFEIGSGTGTHVLHFSPALPWIKWFPSDLNDVSLQLDSNSYITVDSIFGGSFKEKSSAIANIAPPIRFDVTETIQTSLLAGRAGSFDGVLNINMIHITPWACSEGLFTSASYLLKSKGYLITYGAYAVGGVLEPDSNVEFDKKLRGRNPEWGVRDVDDLNKLATLNHLEFVKLIEMASNNKMLVFQKC